MKVYKSQLTATMSGKSKDNRTKYHIADKGGRGRCGIVLDKHESIMLIDLHDEHKCYRCFHGNIA